MSGWWYLDLSVPARDPGPTANYKSRLRSASKCRLRAAASRAWFTDPCVPGKSGSACRPRGTGSRRRGRSPCPSAAWPGRPPRASCLFLCRLCGGRDHRCCFTKSKTNSDGSQSENGGVGTWLAPDDKTPRPYDETAASPNLTTLVQALAATHLADAQDVTGPVIGVTCPRARRCQVAVGRARPLPA